jgi:hypothetical protein
MMKLTLIALAAVLGRAAELPLIISTENATAEFKGAPRIQSFAFGQWQGRWVFIGGRTAGYHAEGGAEAEFLRAQANAQVWVIDTTAQPAKTYCAPVSSLPDSLAAVRDQWMATAHLTYQDGPVLYLAGGYGQNRAGEWLTYALLSKVELPKLIDGVMNGTVPAEAIRFVETPLVQSTGGELMKLSDGFFYLVMGHNFTGSYTAFQAQGEKNRPKVSQEYLNEIRKLKIGMAPDGSPTVTLSQTFRDEKQFHRRDLNVLPFLSPEGSGLAVYGGVFTPDSQLGWTKPVYLLSGKAPVVDRDFDQRMNGYACAAMLLYDSLRGAMLTTFFGGISQHYWDEKSRTFIPQPRIGTRSDAIYLDGLQWSDQISTIEKSPEATREFVQAKPLPGFLGSDAVFIPAPEVPRMAGSEIIDLRAIAGKRTFVGYLFGGIRASPFRFPYTRDAQPYNSGAVPTKPSDMILRVYVEAPKV